VGFEDAIVVPRLRLLVFFSHAFPAHRAGLPHAAFRVGEVIEPNFVAAKILLRSEKNRQEEYVSS
jgi:hypothetical protein